MIIKYNPKTFFQDVKDNQKEKELEFEVDELLEILFYTDLGALSKEYTNRIILAKVGGA